MILSAPSSKPKSPPHSSNPRRSASRDLQAGSAPALKCPATVPPVAQRSHALESFASRTRAHESESFRRRRRRNTQSRISHSSNSGLELLFSSLFVLARSRSMVETSPMLSRAPDSHLLPALFRGLPNLAKRLGIPDDSYTNESGDTMRREGRRGPVLVEGGDILRVRAPAQL